jgi:acetolactate synthase-1/2/3 large subunit
MTMLGIRLVELLEAYGIDTVFGIPGVHTIELYRGLARSRIRHVTPRHEQAAGFMADGYARASGRIAACFVITGPGLTNILTPMAQAYADSSPMLVISSTGAMGQLGMGIGALHELRRQGVLAAECAAFSHTVLTAAELPMVMARAFAVFRGARPRPVHIEIPTDLIGTPCPPLAAAAPLAPPQPDSASTERAAALLARAGRPLILAGGGARHAADSLRSLAERLGAPVVQTVNARGLLGPDHALSVPASPSLGAVRRLVDEADLVLVAGSEIGPTDYDMYGRSAFSTSVPVIRIDIDPEQIGRGLAPEIALIGDCGAALEALANHLPAGPPAADGAARAAAARDAARRELDPALARHCDFLRRLAATAPDVAIVGDSTIPVYAGNLFQDAAAPRRWFNAATGYGALGFGLPAALGAARATGRPVLCLTGDGGLQFVLGELGTAVETGLPVVILVWNNRGYGEIRMFMVEAGIEPIGVDLHTPDFTGLARAYGMSASRPDSAEGIFESLAVALGRPGPSLIEIDANLVSG